MTYRFELRLCDFGLVIALALAVCGYFSSVGHVDEFLEEEESAERGLKGRV